jgi:hypothetical protein
MKAMGHCIFTGSDFFEGAANVNRDGATTGGGPPRHGTGESIVDFEGAWRVLKGLKCLSIARLKPVASQGEQSARGGVAQGESVGGDQIAKSLRIDAAGSVDNGTERLEMTDKRARNGSRSTSRNGPSDRMCGGAQEDCGARTEGPIEGENGVSSEPREESPGANAAKAGGQRVGRLHGGETEARQKQWMSWNPQDRAERTFGKLTPAVNVRPDEPPPGSAICAEFPLSRSQIALQHHGCAVIERMGNGSFSMQPHKAMLCQGKGAEKG